MTSAIQKYIDGLERINTHVLLRTLCATAVAISAVRSIIGYKYSVINDDGVLYLEVSKLIARGEWLEGLKLYPWPAYPALIAGISIATGFDHEISSQIIAAFSSAAVATLVLLIAHRCSPNNLVLVCAFLLVVANPILNQTRIGLLREQPFIAFIAVSVLYYLKYTENGKWKDFTIFFLCCLVAALFRIEGVAFMCLLPLVDRLNPSTSWTQKALVAALLLAFFAMAPYAITWFGRSVSLEAVAIRIDTLRHFSSLPLPTDRARVAYGGMVAGLVLVGTISAIGLPSLVYLVFGVRYRFEGMRPRVVWALASVVVASILIGLFQVTFSLFYDGRHTMPATIATIPLAAVGYAWIARWWLGAALPAAMRATTLVLASALLAYGVAAGVPRPGVSQYQVAAGKWIEAEVPADARVLSNNNLVLYYAHRPVLDSTFLSDVATFWVDAAFSNPDFSKLRDWSQWDYVVFQLSSDQSKRFDSLARGMNGAVVQRFTNSRTDQLVILKIEHRH